MTRVDKTLVSRSERWEGRARDSREGTLLTVGVGSGLLRHKHTAGCLNRPHGQHAVVLAEDAHRFTAYRADHRGEDLSGINPSSRQIYLTFPAESTFTEEDVTSHFRSMLLASHVSLFLCGISPFTILNLLSLDSSHSCCWMCSSRAYGPVQDVRIPYQQKRMFGFVTFVYSETVKAILSEGNPHYICGARVLVKPYREKGKHGDRYIFLFIYSVFTPELTGVTSTFDLGY